MAKPISRLKNLAYLSTSSSWKDLWKPILWGFILFLLLCLSVPSGIKVLALVISITAAICCVVPRFSLTEYLTLPVVAVFLWVCMNGASTFYALSGKFALYEFLKLFFSFGVFLLVLLLSSKTPEKAGRVSATLLETVTAFAGIFSIDLIATRMLSTPLLAFLNVFATDYQEITGLEVGIRMTSILVNPNIFAGCIGIGVLVSLGLATTEENGAFRKFHVVCLAINALSFLLAFSMGASAMIAVAFIAYLFVEQSKRRGELIILMIETLVLAVAAMFPIYLTAFDTWDGMNVVPLLCTVGAAVILCVLDHFSQKFVVQKLATHGKAVLILIAVIFVLLAGYVILALNSTGSITMDAGETLRRSAYPAAGTYTLEVIGIDDATVTIESQNKEDTMMHTSTTLYKGAAQGASFTVPEDSMVVYFNIKTPQGGTLEQVRFQGDNGSASLPLGYKLLPGFVANRLQGLFANQNAIQRVVFFEDGMKLFDQSPIIGLGMGSFENAILGVQSFFYETKYVHNHYIQCLLETGMIGLVLFVGVLATSAFVLLKNRFGKKDAAHPFVPMLFAALVFMAGHAAVEVIFSSNYYLPLALTILALIAVTCGQELPLQKNDDTVAFYGHFAIPALVVVFSCFLTGNMMAQSMSSKNPTFDNLETCISMDRFEWADYMLSYVYSGVQQETITEEMMGNIEEYSKRLEEVNSNTIPIYLAESYFRLGRVSDAFRMIEKSVLYRASDTEAWNRAFDLMRAFHQDTKEYYTGVSDTYAILETWNQENLGTLTLSEDNTAYVTAVRKQMV